MPTRSIQTTAETEFDLLDVVVRDDGGYVAILSEPGVFIEPFSEFYDPFYVTRDGVFADYLAATDSFDVEGRVDIIDQSFFDANPLTFYADQFDFSAASLPNGSTALAWSLVASGDEIGGSLAAVLPDTSDGAVRHVPLFQQDFAVYYPAWFTDVSVLPNGNFAVSQFSAIDGTLHSIVFPSGIDAGRTLTTGTVDGVPDFGVEHVSVGTQSSVLLPHPVGGVIAVDTGRVYENDAFNAEQEIIIQRVALDGSPIEDPVRHVGYQDTQDAVIHPDGSVIVLAQTTAGDPVILQFSLTGDLLVERALPAGQSIEELAVSDSGTIAVTGWDGTDVTLYQFDAELDPLGSQIMNETAAEAPQLALDGDTAAVFWEMEGTTTLMMATQDLDLGDGIAGTDGADDLMGGEGRQVFFALEGDDTMAGGAGGDHYDGGDGVDTVILGESRFVDLQFRDRSVGDAAGDTFANVEVFIADGSNGQLRGNGANNVLDGGAGWDRVYGRAGDDTLLGGRGGDVLYGNNGADVMTGGEGAVRDRYVYFRDTDTGLGAGNRDIITDFISGEDRIELSRLDADITQSGKQGFTYIGDAGFSGTAGELGYRQDGGNTIVEADIDGDGAADFEIELTGQVMLTVDDFLI